MPYTDHQGGRLVANVGLWVAERRRQLYISQRALARATGINQSIISRLEHGLTPGLTLVRLAPILHVLGWPPLPSDQEVRPIDQTPFASY
jgi:transcriptional regulator with XRE-family HTH domain